MMSGSDVIFSMDSVTKELDDFDRQVGEPYQRSKSLRLNNKFFDYHHDPVAVSKGIAVGQADTDIAICLVK
jgi:hypothetical protein